MGDWIYPSPPNKDGSVNSNALNTTLVLPTPEFPNQTVKICFEDDWEYKSMVAGTLADTVTFLYPR